MEWMIELLKNVTELGLIYALVVLGVYLTSHIIKFDDLSIEGSFAVGSALTATLLLCGLHALLVVPCAIAAGCLVGLTTGTLHTKLGMNNLISGIVVTAALFSLNLKVAGPHIVLTQASTLFDLTSGLGMMHVIALLLPLVSMIFLGIGWLLNTEIGVMLKTVGSNPQMLTNLGKSIDLYKISGLMIANGLSALAGSLFVQHMRFFSITGSVGTMIIALAGFIIGQVLCRSSLLGMIAGAVVYQVLIAITIELQLDPTWNKLIASALIVLVIAICKRKKGSLCRRLNGSAGLPRAQIKVRSS